MLEESGGGGWICGWVPGIRNGVKRDVKVMMRCRRWAREFYTRCGEEGVA